MATETPARLRRLLEKYELLIRLTGSEPGRTVQRRDDMRAIAQRFPAALREWEQQPAHEIERRRQRVAAELAGSDPAADERAAPFAAAGADSRVNNAADAAADPVADAAADPAADVVADPAADPVADSAADVVADPAADHGAAGEGWLRYGLDVHDCLRAVLKLRSYLSQQAGGRLPRGDGRSDARPAAFSTQHVTDCQNLVRDCEVPWLTVTAELLAAIADPARGRLAAIAYQAVATRHRVSEGAIKLAIFGGGDGGGAGDAGDAAGD